jgi:hypothetical protein
VALGGDDPELRHLQRLELDLDGSDLGAEALVGEERLAADLLDPGKLLEAADARLGNADAGGANEPPVGPEWAAPVAPTYFNWRKISIYGGSNEIQRNIIAKAILGL